MKAFKAMKPDMTCRGFQYEVGKTYYHKGEVIPCTSGFHSCEKLAETISYYPYDSVFTEVEIPEDSEKHYDKFVSRKIKIVRVLDILEVEKELSKDWYRFYDYTKYRIPHLYWRNVRMRFWLFVYIIKDCFTKEEIK